MKSKPELRLVGYNRTTDEIHVEYVIPPKSFGKAKSVARVASDDPDVAYTYPLSMEQALELAIIAGETSVPDSVDFFLEGYSLEPEEPGAVAPKARYA